MTAKTRSMLQEDPFRIVESGSTVAREMTAGATSFATMAFILIVNPAIMTTAGMDRSDLTMATALAAIVGTLLVGLVANRPLIAAPAMGSNVVFASVLVGQLGIPWQAGLAMVILTGIGFLALSLSELRQRVMDAVPECLRVGIQSAIGLLIIFFALRNCGIVVGDRSTLLRLGNDTDPSVLLPLIGILVTAALTACRVPGGLLLSIIGLSLIGLFVKGQSGLPLTRLPEHLAAWPHWPSHTAFHIDFGYVIAHPLLCAPSMVYFFCSEFFSTLGTLITVGGEAGFDAQPALVRKIFAADAMATIAGPLLGTSVVTIFVESLAGIQAGGRTGLTALTASVLFGLSLLLWPLLIAVPAQATAPAMVIVGVMMLRSLCRLALDDIGQVLPALLTIVFAGFTANLINGMAFGTFTFLTIETIRGRFRGVSPMLWVVAVMFLLFYGATLRFH